MLTRAESLQNVHWGTGIKKRFSDLEHKVEELRIQPKHWHVAVLRKVIEDLGGWVVEVRQSGATGQVQSGEE